MPKNYQVKKPDKLYGEANALTVQGVGRDMLTKAINDFKLPIMATWQWMKSDIESFWDDGSIKDAVVLFMGKLRATGRDYTREVVIPVPIRNGVLLFPSVFRSGEHTDIFTKEAVDDLFSGDQFPRPMPDREYLFAPPPLPGMHMPNRSTLDVYKPLSK